MASGMGTRFGSNKLMAKLNGTPLIQYVIQATENRFEKRVVVTRHDEVAKVCQALGAEAVLHSKPHRNDTVRLGMDAIGECDTVTFFRQTNRLSAQTLLARFYAPQKIPLNAFGALASKARQAPPCYSPHGHSTNC